jgi:hypothetical protein
MPTPTTATPEAVTRDRHFDEVLNLLQATGVRPTPCASACARARSAAASARTTSLRSPRRDRRRGGRISTLHPLPRLDEIVVDVDDTTHAR